MSWRGNVALTVVSLALVGGVVLLIDFRESVEPSSPVAGFPESTAESPTNPNASPQPQSPASLVSAAQFNDLIHKTLNELPTAASLRDLSEEETHDTPETVSEAGTQLGRIAQAVHDNPALAPAAADFYSRCARQAEVLTSVRALCYSHVMKPSDGENDPSIPPEVVRLARQIPKD